MKRNIDFLRLLLLSLAVVTSVMSSSVLTILSPVIVSHFDISPFEFQLRNVFFFSFFSMFLLFFGRVCDEAEPRTLLSLGLIIFFISCLGSYWAAEKEMWNIFVTFQISQAIADGLMVPVIMRLIRVSFSEDILGWAFGTFNAALSVGVIIGPVVGAVLYGYSSWNIVFIFMGMMALFCYFLINRFFWIDTHENVCQESIFKALGNNVSFLFTTLLLCSAAVNLQMYIKSDYTSYKYSGLLLISLFLFTILELLNSEKRLLSYSLFKHKAYSFSSLRGFLNGLYMNSLLLVFPFILISFYGASEALVSSALAMDGLFTILAGSLIGSLVDKFKRNIPIIIGSSISLISLLLFYLFLFYELVYVGTLILYSFSAIACMFIATENSKRVALSVSKESIGSAMSQYQSIVFLSGSFVAILLQPINTGFSISSMHINGLVLGSVTILLLILFLTFFEYLSNMSESFGKSNTIKQK